MSYTHTYAILEISHAAYAEIAKALRAADYSHCFHDEGGRIVIDMSGIALATVQLPGTVRESRAQGGK